MSDTKIIDLAKFRAKDADVQSAALTVDYIHYVDVNLPYEALLRPDYWAHVVHKFMIGNRIRVLPRDHSWFAELLIRDVGSNWAKVGAIVPRVNFEALVPETNLVNVTGFHVEWQSPSTKYCVFRESDNAVVAKGFKTKPEAEAAMVMHASQVARAS